MAPTVRRTVPTAGINPPDVGSAPLREQYAPGAQPNVSVRPSGPGSGLIESAEGEAFSLLDDINRSVVRSRMNEFSTESAKLLAQADRDFVGENSVLASAWLRGRLTEMRDKAMTSLHGAAQRRMFGADADGRILSSVARAEISSHARFRSFQDSVDKDSIEIAAGEMADGVDEDSVVKSAAGRMRDSAKALWRRAGLTKDQIALRERIATSQALARATSGAIADGKLVRARQLLDSAKDLTGFDLMEAHRQPLAARLRGEELKILGQQRGDALVEDQVEKYSAKYNVMSRRDSDITSPKIDSDDYAQMQADALELARSQFRGPELEDVERRVKMRFGEIVAKHESAQRKAVGDVMGYYFNAKKSGAPYPGDLSKAADLPKDVVQAIEVMDGKSAAGALDWSRSVRRWWRTGGRSHTAKAREAAERERLLFDREFQILDQSLAASIERGEKPDVEKYRYYIRSKLARHLAPKHMTALENLLKSASEHVQSGMDRNFNRAMNNLKIPVGVFRDMEKSLVPPKSSKELGKYRAWRARVEERLEDGWFSRVNSDPALRKQFDDSNGRIPGDFVRSYVQGTIDSIGRDYIK